jgi:hypothetical protein
MVEATMTIQEAIKSGKPFQRKPDPFHDGFYFFTPSGRIYRETSADLGLAVSPAIFSDEDILATDWEVKPSTELTKKQVDVIRKQVRLGDNLVTSTHILELADACEKAWAERGQLRTDLDTRTEAMLSWKEQAVQFKADRDSYKHKCELHEGSIRGLAEEVAKQREVILELSHNSEQLRMELVETKRKGDAFDWLESKWAKDNRPYIVDADENPLEIKVTIPIVFVTPSSTLLEAIEKAQVSK